MRVQVIHRTTNHVMPLASTTLSLRAVDRGAEMLCCAGTCWVTEEGVFEDHVLRGGNAYRPRGNGLIVVYALSDSELEFERCRARANPPRPALAPGPTPAPTRWR